MRFTNPSGSLTTAASLGAAADDAHVAMVQQSDANASQRSQLLTRRCGCDHWFVDGGQLFQEPDRTDGFLQALDHELQKRGARRDTGPDRKSVARLLGPAGTEAQHPGWCTNCIRNSCRTPGHGTAVEVLGAPVGLFGDISGVFRKAVEKTKAVHGKLPNVEGAATELVLTRKCADVCRVSDLLSCCGDRIDEADLEDFDRALRYAVGPVARGDLEEEAWMQATIGVKHGGLGTPPALPKRKTSNFGFAFVVVF